MLSTIGALLPRDGRERQPKRWQKSQRKRRVLGTLKKMKAKREKVEQNAMARAERLAGVPEKKKKTQTEEEPTRVAVATPSASVAVPLPSHSTPFGLHSEGLWAAELTPYQPLVVRIPAGVDLCLMRASLAANGTGTVGGVSAVRCRTPATKLPSTLCVLQRVVTETCGLSALFSSRDQSCALAVEGPEAVHIIGYYVRHGPRLSEPAQTRPAPPLPQPQPQPQPPLASGGAGAARAKEGKPAGGKAEAVGAQLVSLGEGLKYADVKVGKGRPAARGTKLSVKYAGLAPDPNAATGWREFDSNNGKAFHFALGAGEVIRGWEIGLIGMRQGGTRRLVVPSQLGYGDAGAGPIPPKATLIFEISLLNVV